jgi:hypothetical protein
MATIGVAAIIKLASALTWRFCAIMVEVMQRDVAQLGSAPALGAGCRRFESCHPDFNFRAFWL